MIPSKRWAIALIPFVAAALTAACEDTIIKTLGPENNEVVSRSGGTFRYESFNLDNVHGPSYLHLDQSHDDCAGKAPQFHPSRHRADHHPGFKRSTDGFGPGGVGT